MVNRSLPEKRSISIGLRLGYIGYRFGIAFYGIQVWDWTLWDIRLAFGFMRYRLGIGFYGI